MAGVEQGHFLTPMAKVAPGSGRLYLGLGRAKVSFLLFTKRWVLSIFCKKNPPNIYRNYHIILKFLKRKLWLYLETLCFLDSSLLFGPVHIGWCLQQKGSRWKIKTVTGILKITYFFRDFLDSYFGKFYFNVLHYDMKGIFLPQTIAN